VFGNIRRTKGELTLSLVLSIFCEQHGKERGSGFFFLWNNHRTYHKTRTSDKKHINSVGERKTKNKNVRNKNEEEKKSEACWSPRHARSKFSFWILLVLSFSLDQLFLSTHLVFLFSFFLFKFPFFAYLHALCFGQNNGAGLFFSFLVGRLDRTKREDK